MKLGGCVEFDPMNGLVGSKDLISVAVARNPAQAVPLTGAYFGASAAAESAVAMALEISAGSPIFLIERTSYTSGHRAVDYERLHYRGDQIRFRTRLTRRRVPRTPKRG
jgi:hypothetical protein